MEVAYTHCWDILVSEGDEVLGGQEIYTEGNTGELVFYKGIKVSAGQKRLGYGSHSHIHVRPVERVKGVVAGHYLADASGRKYKDEQGNYYRIKHIDNKTKGTVDYSQWLFIPAKLLFGIPLSIFLALFRPRN